MNKNFSLFLISSASTLLNIEIFHLAIPLTVLSLGYSAVEASWCTFAFLAPVILVKLFLAPSIEYRHKKPLLLQNEIIRTLIVIVFILLLYFMQSKQTIFWILLTAFLFGTFATMTEIAEPAALKMLLQNQDSTAVLSKYEIRTRAVQLLAPTLCGLLISAYFLLPYLFMLIISLLSILLLTQLTLVEPQFIREKRGVTYFLTSIREGMLWLNNKPLFMKMVILTAINNFLHPILYLTIIYQLTTSAVGFDITGYILSGLGIGGIIGSLCASYLLKIIGLNRLVVMVNILRIAIFAGFMLFSSPLGYFLFFVFKAILGGIWNVCYNVYTINEMPQNYISRISALSGLIIKIFTAIAGLLAGYLINYLGVNATLIFLVVLTVIMFLYTLDINKYQI